MVNWAEELEKLTELRDKGILTHQEWQKEKERLLPSHSTTKETEEPKELSGKVSPLTVLFLILVSASSVSVLFFKMFELFSDSAKLSDTDDGVVQLIALFVIPPLFLAILFMRQKKNLPMSYLALPSCLFSFPYLIETAIAGLRWENISEQSLYKFVEDVVEPGYWLYVGSAASLSLVALWIIFKQGKTYRKPRGSLSEILLGIGSLALLVGHMFPILKPMECCETANRYKYRTDSDFTPFTWVFDDAWEFFVGGFIAGPIIIIIAALLIFWAPSQKSFQAGLFGMFYLSLALTAIGIAGNAEAEIDSAWSLGGWLMVASVFLFGAAALGNGAAEMKKNKQDLSSSPNWN